MQFRRNTLGLLIWLMVGWQAALAAPDLTGAMRATYQARSAALQHSPFKRALILESADSGDLVQGDVYGALEFPIGVVASVVKDADRWCEVMLLLSNTKRCKASNQSPDAVIQINIGNKTPEDIAATASVKFQFHVNETSTDHLELSLNAKDGPLGTSDYRIRLEAVAISSAMTFVHFSYSYKTNALGRLGMQSYLYTLGRGKVGFSLTQADSRTTATYIDGVRGVIERNTMRYFLALESALSYAQADSSTRFESMANQWFDSVERYPRQLHEMDRESYMEMKRAEYGRSALQN
jgi:hypothetical protein